MIFFTEDVGLYPGDSYMFVQIQKVDYLKVSNPIVLMTIDDSLARSYKSQCS